MIALALLLAATGATLETIGVWDRWAALRDTDPRRCYAIASPVTPGARKGPRPFASVAAAFGRDRRSTLFVRLSTDARPAARVTLSIGARRFTLSAQGSAAWAPDAATDRAIVAAMRGSRSMSIAAVSVRGNPFADTYALTGAATAIDAAVLGCART